MLMLSNMRAMIMLVILVAVLMGSPKLTVAADPISAAITQSPAPSSTGGSCAPANCAAQCNPACSSDMICTLTTMSECGVCPASVCVSKAVLGSPSSPSNSSDSSGSNAGLLPGLVGGFIGLLVIAVGAFAFIRYKRRKAQGLPFWKSADSSTDSSDRWSRPNTQSAVVPIAYMPPSTQHPRMEMQTASIGPSISLRNSLALSNQNDYLQHPSTPNSHSSRYSTRSENPFADLDDESTVQLKRVVTLRKRGSLSNEGSQMSHNVDDDNDDESVASSVVNHLSRKDSKSAVQMQRAKPTLMRINTIKVEDGSGLKRSGSLRTVLTPETGSIVSQRSNSTKTGSGSESLPSQSVTSLTAVQASSDDNPFHDRHSIIGNDDTVDEHSKQERSASIVTSGSHRTNVTDSVMSAPGDGEITIFWDSNGSSRNNSD